MRVLGAALAVLLVSCGGGASSTAPAGAGSAAAGAGRVLIIGMDGARVDGLLAASTPRLDALMAEGAFDLDAITGDVSLSGPGWASMLTGVWCDKHQVLDNDATWAAARFDEYPHFMRRLEALDPDAVTASISHWAPINDEIVCAGSGECPVDVVVNADSDAQVRDEAVRVLGELDPRAVFLQFDDIDHAGHGDPPYLPPDQGGFCPFAEGDPEYDGQIGSCTAADFNPAYLEAIETTDGYIGDVLAALRSRPRFAEENWLVLVSPDHGGGGVVMNQHGFPHAQDRRTFLVIEAEGLRALPEARVKIVDIAATALAHLGVMADASWELDGQVVGIVPPDAYQDRDIPECADQIGVFGDAR